VAGCSVHASSADLTGRCRACEAARRSDAWAEWVAGLRTWDLFGGLTFDQRRPGRDTRTSIGWRRVVTHPSWGTTTTRESPRVTEDGAVRLARQPIARDVAVGRVMEFFDQGEWALRRRLYGVVAVEHQRNGWPHFHPLIAVQGGLQGDEKRLLGGLWYRACGYGRLEEPRSRADTAAYASKYLVKDVDAGGVVIWPQKGNLRA
jgi:hypothetical protein